MVERTRWAHGLLAIALTAACGGSDGDAPRAGESLPASSAAGSGSGPAPTIRLLRGVQDGVMITVNGGTAHAQLNDQARAALRDALVGQDVTFSCGDLAGSIQWPVDRNEVTLFLLGDGEARESCTLAVNGQPRVEVPLAVFER